MQDNAKVSLTAANQSAVLNIQPGSASAALTLAGTFSGTVVFEAAGDRDGSDWTAIAGFPFSASAPVTSATAVGGWSFLVGGLKRLRARCSVFTSGSIDVVLNQSTSQFAAVVLTVPQSLGTADTPRFLRLGIGADADATLPLNVLGKLQADANGLLTKVGNIATVGNGVPAELANLDLTAQGPAAITTATLYANPASLALYRLSYYLFMSTAGDAVNVAATFGWTDPGTNAKTSVSANAAGQTAGSFVSGSVMILAKASTNITYAVAVGAGLGAGRFDLYVRLEKL